MVVVRSTPVKSVPARIVPVRSTPASLHPVRSAPVRSACVIFTPSRFRPDSLAPMSFAPVSTPPATMAPRKSAFVRSAPARLTPFKLTPERVAPCMLAPASDGGSTAFVSLAPSRIGVFDHGFDRGEIRPDERGARQIRARDRHCCEVQARKIGVLHVSAIQHAVLESRNLRHVAFGEREAGEIHPRDIGLGEAQTGGVLADFEEVEGGRALLPIRLEARSLSRESSVVARKGITTLRIAIRVGIDSDVAVVVRRVDREEAVIRRDNLERFVAADCVIQVPFGDWNCTWPCCRRHARKHRRRGGRWSRRDTETPRCPPPRLTSRTRNPSPEGFCSFGVRPHTV